ncbi:hypothetical protein D9M68_949900 [compost metagenome]
MRRQTSSPSMPGIIRSRMTSSGWMSCSCSRPASPSAAWVTSKPDWPRYSTTIVARRASSSIINSWDVMGVFVVAWDGNPIGWGPGVNTGCGRRKET